MNIRVADKEEFAGIRSFYHKLIDMMEGAEHKPAWEKNVYPSDDYLQESLENGEMWVCESEWEYAAAMIVNHRNNEGYRDVRWSIEAGESDVLVVHVLGVLPTFQGKGIGARMVSQVIELAERTNQKAIRLDVLEGNIPAERLYTKCGFRYIDTIEMFYEDTGWTNFKLFEYIVASDPS